MKQIGNLVNQIKQETSLQVSQTNAKAAQIACLTKKYSTFEQLGAAFNPTAAARLPNNIDKVFNSDTPTLLLVSEVYGREKAIKWIEVHINSIDLYTQVKNDLNEGARNEMANLILSHYGFLKLPEFMLFVARFKLGIYGRFYGSFDPLVLCEALKKFRIDRNEELERIRIRNAQRETEERAVQIPEGYTSWTWYQELKKRAEAGDLEAIESLKPPKK
nr:MAG TPA: hypothetical protein [Caudoviricetes sp.]